MTQKEINKFLTNIKVYVNGKSKEVQEKLFSFDCCWGDKEKEVRRIDKPFLFLDENKKITWGDNMEYFTENPKREIFVDDLLSLKLTEPSYRPFKNREECWNEMLKHQPFGWLLDEDGNGDAYKLLNSVGEIGATTGYNSLYFKELFELMLFADGTPFGIKEE